MKLNKKLEAEILNAYNAIWGAYLKGDMRVFASMLDDNCHIIGSAAGEVFNSKKSAVKYYKSTAEQITGKAEFRKRKISVMPVDKGVMVNEQSDFYVLIDNQWTFYGPARISSLFHKKKNKWKVIHQHGSFPDSKTEEGEQVNTEKIKAENLQLRDAVKRRTVELEDKNRELEIEAALERVRARTMAMQKSDELAETSLVLFQQFKDLGATSEQVSIGIFKVERNVMELYSTLYGSKWKEAAKVDLDEPVVMKKIYAAWKQQKKSLLIDIAGNELLKYNAYRKKLSNLEYNEDRWVIHIAFFSKGVLTFSTTKPHPPETIHSLERFAGVFDQTYTRFLDLQNAEAQAREAQIEAGLERVRSRSLAMHNTSELQEVIHTVHKELLNLNIAISGGSFIVINSDIETTLCCWGSGGTADTSEEVHLPLYEKPFCTNLINRIKNGSGFFTEEYTQQEKKDFFTFLFKYEPWSRLDAKQKNETLSSPGGYTRSCCVSQHTSIFIINHFGEKFTAADNEILKRFGKVFEQTYTRFLDLQKAEAQAREAKIEASLERVRAKAMAMQKSDDLAAAVAIVFEQLDYLNLGMLRCGIGILNKEKRSADVWTTTKSENDTVVQVSGDESMDIHPLLTGAFEAWLNQSDFSYILEGDDLARYYSTQSGDSFKLPESQLVLSPSQIQQQYYYLAKFYSGGLFAFSDSVFTDEVKQVMKRFANVFDLTYKRFLDLKKAEAQAREAQIEAALERVRGKAMAMHNSNDVSAAASMVFTELRKLGITPIRCGVGLLNKESRKAQLYSATSSPAGDSLSLVGWVELSDHPVLENIYDTWLKNDDYYPELSGEQLGSYYQLLLRGLSVTVPDWQSGDKQYGHFFPFSVGCLYAWSETRYNEAEVKILKRFATIIDLTFRRYMDLQKSEATAREAIKQATLDRVRADIASMRAVSDLDRITPLIWKELTILGIPFIRCGVFIMDESQKLIHTFLSTPDGKAIAAFHLPYTTPGNIAQVLGHWHDKKNYIDHWDESDFTEFAKILEQQQTVVSAEQYLKTIADGGFYLHFLPFLQGMLYVGNTSQLGEDEINLIQSVADAFSTAYARYEDFNRLEAAKQQVDKTLVELKLAQTQLVQSEKMASLGELTAGIAHEIQNPLNFVNNFSEVSNELLEEMKNELEKGNKEDAMAIVEDVRQNLEKILHHGKRADAIVKGMLQHSRANSGQKEPTDINALADEYLRLAFHGLRAKDKSFNAKFETDFDSSIGKLNVIPQEIGRVILNLINNAFYTVTEKRKQNQNGYEPTVTVTTRKLSDKIEIRIRDNGNGIPQKNLDKIFQPFFTTKPTGQGTGLGLSLSYDIITKGHGGEMKVETQEGEGAVFIIKLPTE